MALAHSHETYLVDPLTLIVQTPTHTHTHPSASNIIISHTRELRTHMPMPVVAEITASCVPSPSMGACFLLCVFFCVFVRKDTLQPAGSVVIAYRRARRAWQQKCLSVTEHQARLSSRRHSATSAPSPPNDRHRDNSSAAA